MDYLSTRNINKVFNTNEVLELGLAPDGGLFIPKKFPTFSKEEIKKLENKSYKFIAFSILEKFLSDLFSKDEIETIIDEAYYSFDDKIVSITELDNLKLLNLFHGPTLAFKDYAMSLLAKIYEYYLKKNNRNLMVLGATSGDTGSAAINAFQGLENIKICILHPHNGTSEFQRKQMTTVGSDNVFNVALEGSFDDCQSIVKKAFNDKELLQKQSLTAVNSINWFRILPQTIYYAWAISNYNISSFVVPTGNFGNIYAAYALKKMGFLIKDLVIATNENNILDRFIQSNDLSLKKVIKTNSPSMDIMISSNFERLVYDFLGPDNTSELFINFSDTRKSLHIEKEAYSKIKNIFKSGMTTSFEVLNEIKNTYKNNNLILDPHTAVGVSVARKMQISNICSLACAHPVKFQDTVNRAINENNLIYDKSINFKNPERYDILSNDYSVLKKYIIEHA
ncbi:MAG: threonine synthase [Pelagibacteraceae bacterium]|nr:threonine synthase [Pelagibacteraceae bacterium]|tara:strand:- start:2269 stop:3624 length:1356 start_codon:yes stop_codon:yes gene_type:complete